MDQQLVWKLTALLRETLRLLPADKLSTASPELLAWVRENRPRLGDPTAAAAGHEPAVGNRACRGIQAASTRGDVSPVLTKLVLESWRRTPRLGPYQEPLEKKAGFDE